MCKTLTIEKKNAIRAYNEADDKGKKLLTDLLGEKAVTPDKITDVVKTFEDACAALGLEPGMILPFMHGDALADDIVSIQAFAKLTVIARALNEGWQPDWNNSTQAKYYPYFKYNGGGSGSSGFGLSDYGYVCDGTYTGLGSRLVFKSAELATYAGTQFTDIYNDFLTIKNENNG